MRVQLSQTHLRIFLTVVLAGVLSILACALPGNELESTPTLLPAATDTPTATLTDIPTPTATPSPVPTEAPLREGSIAQITLDHDGDLWSVGSGGVTRWDIDTGSYYTFSVDDGVPNSAGQGILTDAQGQIWVTWENGIGVSRYSQGEWSHFDTAHGLADNSVSGMALADDGRLWFATTKGISSFDGEDWISYTIDDGLPSNVVPLIDASPGGQIWAATDAGVTSFDGVRWIDHSRLQDDIISDIIATSDGLVWFATDRGIIFLEDEGWWVVRGSTGRMIPQVPINSFVVATDGTLWARGPSFLAVYDGNAWNWFTADEGAPASIGRGLLAAQDGSIWVPSNFALRRVSDWDFYGEGRFRASVAQICTGDVGVELGGSFSVDDLEEATCLDVQPRYSGPTLQTPDGTMVFVYGLRNSDELLVLRNTLEYAIFGFEGN